MGPGPPCRASFDADNSSFDAGPGLMGLSALSVAAVLERVLERGMRT
jgi:hypothetical protein